MGYDLSKVMFIATANSLSTIQTPLVGQNGNHSDCGLYFRGKD
jgi:hypothetical protein